MIKVYDLQSKTMVCNKQGLCMFSLLKNSGELIAILLKWTGVNITCNFDISFIQIVQIKIIPLNFTVQVIILFIIMFH